MIRTRIASTCVCVCGVLTTLTAQNALSQAPPVVPRLHLPVRFDGKPNEPAWDAALSLPLAVYEPIDGKRTERSVILIAHDGEYLYAAARFDDSNPRAIRAPSLVRDYYAGDDQFNLVLDTFHDRRTAVWFIVNPNGARIDGSIANDAEGVWNHPEYDMLWDAKAQVDSTGWTAEVRIPLSSLGYRVDHGRAAIGLIAARLIARKDERQIFPAIRPLSANAKFKPSLAQTVYLEGIPTSRTWRIAPYAAGRWEQSSAAGSAPQSDVGVDAKAVIGQGVALDLSVNTDFAQAEADDQRVNLTRFSPLFPEKRQFFLERANAFEFFTGPADRVFHSRRIGLNADGRARPIRGGGRVAASLGAWELGLLEIQEGEAGGAAAENAAVFRLRRSLGSSASYVGGIATNVITGTGRTRQTLGLDGSVRLPSDYYITLSGASTSDSLQPHHDAFASWLQVERRRRVGLASSFSIARIGAGYSPAVGFVERNGLTRLSATANWGSLATTGAIREHVLSLGAAADRDLLRRVTERATAEASWSITWRRGGQTRIFARRSTLDFGDTLKLGGGVAGLPGKYSNVDAGFTMNSPPGAVRRLAATVDMGSFYDGRRATVGVSPSWNPSPHLELASDIELNRVVFVERGQTFRGDIMRVRTRLAVTPNLSLSAFTQYNAATRATGTNVRLRYTFQDGSDFYIVGNDLRTSSPSFTTPGTRSGRSVTTKLVWTFR